MGEIVKSILPKDMGPPKKFTKDWSNNVHKIVLVHQKGNQ